MNRRPRPYQGRALPTVLRDHGGGYWIRTSGRLPYRSLANCWIKPLSQSSIDKTMELAVGLEPTTTSLQVRCATIAPRQRMYQGANLYMISIPKADILINKKIAESALFNYGGPSGNRTRDLLLARQVLSQN